jgi:hypothetical protein
MFTSAWTFLQDPVNRAVFSWIGGGIVVFVGGIWGIFKFLVSKRRLNVEKASIVSAGIGGMAAGRDISNSTIAISNAAKRERRPC